MNVKVSSVRNKAQPTFKPMLPLPARRLEKGEEAREIALALGR